MKTGHTSDAAAPAQVRFVRLWSCIVIGTLVVAASATAGDAPAADEDWEVQIVAAASPPDRLIPPLPETDPAGPATAAASADERQLALLDDAQGGDAAAGIVIRPAWEPIGVEGRSYEEVYRSIPYSYTEYLANPGYRHDATMEILFGELRPTTIHRHHEPELIWNDLPSPYQPYRFSHPEYRQYRAPAFRLLDPGCCW